MSTSEFDRQLQEQYDRGGFEYNPAAWQHMQQQLDMIQPARSRKTFVWLPYTGIAASVALIIVLSFFFYTKREHTASPVVTVQHAAPAAPINNTQTNTTAAQSQIPATQQAFTGAQSYKPHTAASQKKEQQISVVEKIPVNTPAVTAQSQQEKETATTTVQPVTEDKKKPTYITAVIPDELIVPHQEKSAKSSLNLAGGFHYGSLNAGYAFAVNARTKIGDKFYLEGDLAFVNNNPQHASGLSQAQYNAATGIGGTFNQGTAAAHAPPANTSVNTLSYLQFAPAIGYHLTGKLSVGAGADVQRMLQNNDDKTVIDANGSVKLVPDIDFGLTAKTEYAITSRLKTGIMYREGLNGLTDSKYLNRRYVQMQLKLRLFEK